MIQVLWKTATVISGYCDEQNGHPYHCNGKPKLVRTLPDRAIEYKPCGQNFGNMTFCLQPFHLQTFLPQWSHLVQIMCA